jgi:hypothetical protein
MSEFATYFNLAPSTDPCIVKDYKIYSNITGETPVEWSGDNQVKLIGSMDSANPYYVRIDKTVVTGAKVFHIGAITRGLKMVAQAIEVTVCPNQGGVTVTPPVQAISHMVARGSSGADANAPFTAWAVMDIYEKCGMFWKYDIGQRSGHSASVLSRLTYPEPGKVRAQDCLKISDCLDVRVSDTSSTATLEFDLLLYPSFGQDPVRIPYTVYVTPCLTATFSAPVKPPVQVIKRSAVVDGT